MCVIIHIQPNAEIPVEKFKNAIWNNEDGFGILIRKKRRGKVDEIEVIRNAKSPSDPKQILEILENNKKHEMMLHVRNATKGSVSEQNCHPFLAFEEAKKTNKRQVFFAHNGTLYSYGTQEKCDSLDWCEQILSKVIPEIHDYDYNSSVLFDMIMEKYWLNENVNKGIVFSNYSDPKEIGKGWEELCEGIRVSNNTYFDRLQRGREHDRRKREAEVALAEKRRQEGAMASPGTEVGFPRPDRNNHAYDFNRIPALNGFDSDSCGLALTELFDNDELAWTMEELAALSALTPYDVIDIVEADYKKITDDHEGMAAYSLLPILITGLFNVVSKLYNDNDAMENDLDDATNKINDLEEKNKRAGRMIAEVVQKAGINMEDLKGDEDDVLAEHESGAGIVMG